MQKDQFDEATIKLITEVVLRVLAELNCGTLPAASLKPEAAQEAAAGCCCGSRDPDPVFIPGKGIGKNLITEREVMQLVQQKQTTLVCPKNTIITALAADRLKAEGITVVRQ